MSLSGARIPLKHFQQTFLDLMSFYHDRLISEKIDKKCILATSPNTFETDFLIYMVTKEIHNSRTKENWGNSKTQFATSFLAKMLSFSFSRLFLRKDKKFEKSRLNFQFQGNIKRISICAHIYILWKSFFPLRDFQARMLQGGWKILWTAGHPESQLL